MLLLVLCALTALSVAFSGPSPFPYCDGTPNRIPFFTDSPLFLRSVRNGDLYRVGSDDYNSTTYIAHLYGSSSYEMGKAYGSLMPDAIRHSLFDLFDAFIASDIRTFFHKMPEWLVTWIEDLGLFPALDLLWEMEAKHTNPHFAQFMHGMADASGVPYERVRAFNMMPQALHAACTLAGAFGTATPGGGLQQLRALDMQPMPLLYYPTIYVYHWNNTDGSRKSNPTVIFAGSGYAGYLSGMSKVIPDANNDPSVYSYLALSEKVWASAGLPRLTEEFGVAWHFDFFDALRYATGDVSSGVSLLQQSNRTVSVFGGLGSSHPASFEVIHYNAKHYGTFAHYDWKNQPSYEPGHPRIADVAYLDKNVQPSSDKCLPSILSSLAAKKQISGETFVREVVGYHQTGWLQVIAWDFDPAQQDPKVYVGMSRGGDDLLAYQKQFVVLDVEKDLFGVKHRK